MPQNMWLQQSTAYWLGLVVVVLREAEALPPLLYSRLLLRVGIMVVNGKTLVWLVELDRWGWGLEAATDMVLSASSPGFGKAPLACRGPSIMVLTVSAKATRLPSGR